MDEASKTEGVPEETMDVEEGSELCQLADELVAIAEEHGADNATIILNFPEEHPMYGWDVTVSVKAQYEEVPDEVVPDEVAAEESKE